MLPGRHENRKWLNKQLCSTLCTSYCLNRISIRAIWRRFLFFGVLFTSNQVNKEVEPRADCVPWEHISMIISTNQSKRRQSSLLEKHNLFLNVLFLYLWSLAAQFSCYEAVATTAQAKANYLDSLQFWETLLSIYIKKITPGDMFHKKRTVGKPCQKVMSRGSSYPALIARFSALSFLQRKIWGLVSFEGKKDKVQNK